MVTMPNLPAPAIARSNMSAPMIVLLVGIPLAAISYTPIGEALAGAAARSLVGLPITVFLYALPTAVLVYALLLALNTVTARCGFAAPWVCSVTVLSAFAVTASLSLGQWSAANAANLVASDRAMPRMTPNGDIALIGMGRACGPGCAALLMAGANRVLVAAPGASLADGTKVTAYRLADGPLCGALGRWSAWARPPATLLASRKSMRGCFVSAPAELGEATTLFRMVRPAATERWAWISKGIATLERGSLFVRLPQGWVERGRETSVTYADFRYLTLTKWSARSAFDINFAPALTPSTSTIRGAGDVSPQMVLARAFDLSQATARP